MSNTTQGSNDGDFGTAGYGFDRQYETLKIKKDAPPFEIQIAPPVKSLSGRRNGWAVGFGLHFGYKRKGRSPEKPRYAPFLCLEEKDQNRDGMIVAQDELDPRLRQLKIQRQQVEAWCKGKGIEPAAFRKQNTEFDQLCNYLYNHDRNFRQYMGARTRAGKFAILQVSHTTYKNLRDNVLPELEAKGYTPISVDNGVWFKVWGTGMGRERKDFFQPVTTQVVVNGVRAEVIQTEAWSQEVRAAYKAAVPDLNAYRERYRLPPQAIRELVESDGGVDAVEAVWQKYRANDTTQTVEDQDNPDDDLPPNFGAGPTAVSEMPPINLGFTKPAAPPQPAPAPTNTAPAPVTTFINANVGAMINNPATPSATPPTDPIADQIAQLQAKLAALQGPPAPQQTETTPPTPPTPPATGDFTLSDAQLDALFKARGTGAAARQ